MSCYVGSTTSESGTNISLLKSIRCWDSSTWTVPLTEVEGWAAEYSWIFIDFSGDISYSASSKLCAITGLIPMSDFVNYVRTACSGSGSYVEIYLPGVVASGSTSGQSYTIGIRYSSRTIAAISESHSTSSSSVGFRYLTLYGMK